MRWSTWWPRAGCAPIVTGRYPLEAVEQAHERQRTHAVIGREVLEP